MVIDSGDVLANANERAQWNNVPLEQITLIDRDGNHVKITAEEACEWAFIGLSNFDFLLKKIDELTPNGSLRRAATDDK